jgi:DNA excision repair protein ERCC-2
MTPDSPKYEFRTSVRELVSFVHGAGGLASEAGFRATNRALEGAKGHRRLQKARGDLYEAEVSVQRLFTQGHVSLLLNGRIDGVIGQESPPIIEEIKTVEGSWPETPDAVHLAQLRVYAAILGEERGWSEIETRLTYLDLGTDLETAFSDVQPINFFTEFLEQTVAVWFEWLQMQAAHWDRRNASVQELPFPFAKYREGQHVLARSVYRAIRDSQRLFVEAPTGLGKTMAVLYPAVKALPLLGEGKVFYLTAKTPGRKAAADALENLRNSGACLRGIELTAKRKICFAENPEAGCDPRICPYATSYYDNIKPALRELLQEQKIDRPVLEAAARKHMVCPFELSLDASLWCDVVIGDFNYLFDPSAQLQRFFADGAPRHVALVDEAHNLVERSREMHSSTISPAALEIRTSKLRAAGATKTRRVLAETRAVLEDILQSPPETDAIVHERGERALAALPEDLISALRQGAWALEFFLVSLKPGTDASEWMEPWFVLREFLKAAEMFDETCRLLLSADRARIFCLDPSSRLREVLAGVRATIFFSATLSPMPYFQDLLGGTDTDMSLILDSPFQSEQMALRILPHDVTYKARQASRQSVAEAVKAHVLSVTGNHLIFGPSFEYVDQLTEDLSAMGVEVFCQSPSMDEGSRQEFLARFETEGKKVGLAVLGGIFGEGIDLPGSLLVGVTVIGVGMPRMSLERDLLLKYFETRRGAGFDYAYRFPGMQRVLQAIGRLIRTESDQGAALLIDSRFREGRYRKLFPSWWHPEWK